MYHVTNSDDYRLPFSVVDREGVEVGRFATREAARDLADAENAIVARKRAAAPHRYAPKYNRPARPRKRNDASAPPWMDRDSTYFIHAQEQIHRDDLPAVTAVNKLDRTWRPDPAKVARAEARLAKVEASRPARIAAYARELYANDVANGLPHASQAVLDAYPAPRVKKRNRAAPPRVAPAKGARRKARSRSRQTT